jgi:hypothetical protein
VEDEVAHLRDLDLKGCALGAKHFPAAGRRLLARKYGNNAFQ